jgi:hypothetical protein
VGGAEAPSLQDQQARGASVPSGGGLGDGSAPNPGSSGRSLGVGSVKRFLVAAGHTWQSGW